VKKIHVAGVAVVLGLAAIFGVVAAVRTSGLAASAAQPRVSREAIAARARQLDRVEASLRKALADRPPALPPLAASAPARPAPSARVVYRRAAPVVTVEHRDGGEAGEEYEHEDGEDDD